MVSNEADPIRVASLDVVGFTIGLPRCQDGILGCGRNLPNCSFSRYAKRASIVPPGPSPLVGRDRLLRSFLRTQRNAKLPRALQTCSAEFATLLRRAVCFCGVIMDPMPKCCNFFMLANRE